MIKPASTPGQVQIYLEAAREHFNHAWGGLRKENIIPWRNNDPMYPNDKYPIGSSPYHLQAAEMYVQACIEGMYEFLGMTDGQLCPNEQCYHDLAFDGPGWWRCPNCLQPFWAEDVDGDFEDYHVFLPSSDGTPVMPRLEHIHWARDLGRSWATPHEPLAPEAES